MNLQGRTPWRPPSVLPPSAAVPRERSVSSAPVFADAPKSVQRPDEHLAARNRRRGVALFRQLALRDQLVLRPALDHERLPRVAREVEVVAGRNGRCAVVLPEPLLPDQL